MSDEPDYNPLYETAESQAGYFTATQVTTVNELVAQAAYR